MPLFARSDFRDAARGLARTPAVTIAAILCLALGLGATAAVSSAVDRALLQPPPYRDPGRLVTVYRTAPQANTWPQSAPNYLDLAHETRELSGLAAATWARASGILRVDDQSLQPRALRVTGNFFPLVGAAALYGRLLTPADDSAGAPDVMVISEPFWRQHFGGDVSIVGRTVQYKGTPSTVVGVLPRDFRYVQGSQNVDEDVWLPMRFSDNERTNRGSNYLMMIGRLAPHATVVSANRELVALFDGLVKTYPMLKDESMRAVPLEAEAVRAVRTPMLLVFGAVCMVLLIAASNVACLLLARGIQRRREIAIRSALGGSRWAVVRPVLAESLLLTGVGLAAGLALAWGAVRTIGALAASQIPQLSGLTLDARVVGFAVALGVVTAALCGVIPAWRGAAVDPQDALRGGRGGGTGREHHHLLRGLVIAEVALSLVLLIGASLVLRGFAGVLHADPGFDAARILALDVTVAPTTYGKDAEVRQFLSPALEAIRALPGVAGAGAIDAMPFSVWGDNFNIRYEGQPGDNANRLPLAEYREATPGFFAATAQRLLAGRLFTPADYQKPNSPVVVVANEALVKRDFTGRDPIGQRYYIGDTTFATIVGVVSDIRNVGPFAPPFPEVYYPFQIADPGATSASLMVRVKAADPAAIESAVRAAVHRVDPAAAITRMMPMTDVIARSVGQPRFYLTLLAVFAAVALLLCVTGLYGVMSYSVAQQARDLGIRHALGSPAGRIVALVMREAALLLCAGTVVGAAGGAAAAKLLRGLLYGTSPADPAAWALAALGMGVAGFVASLIPARRATRVDPLVAMREQ